jgi:hypothetical protein
MVVKIDENEPNVFPTVDATDVEAKVSGQEIDVVLITRIGNRGFWQPNSRKLWRDSQGVASRLNSRSRGSAPGYKCRFIQLLGACSFVVTPMWVRPPTVATPRASLDFPVRSTIKYEPKLTTSRKGV